MENQDLQSRPPSQCGNMAELRAEIDRVDRALVRLLSERQRYIERAAEIKSRHSDIRDEDRIRDILDKVRAEAAKAGLNVEIAAAVWRELMERCIALEMDTFVARTQRAR
jgi:isochorismate pyruvate lyase